MKKIFLFVITLLISVLLIGCGSSNSINNDDNTQAKGDWPVYDFKEIMDEVDLIAFTTVKNTQSKEKTGDDDQDSLDAKISELKINDIVYSKSKNTEETIELDQAENFVEQGKSYLLFLNKKDDDYYVITDGNSTIPEKDKMYQVDVPGIEGEYDKKQFSELVEDETSQNK